MPAPAKPPLVQPPPPPKTVHSAGQQEDFESAAYALGAKLGWDGDADWICAEIAVKDACGYLTKVLHERHIAGAKGDAEPAYAPVAAHLGITDPNEFLVLGQALHATFEAGKGAPLSEHAVKVVNLGASLVKE